MEESILRSTKKILNIPMDDDSFDHDIITHINSAFFHLFQLGVGPPNGFVIDDATAVWSDFLNEETQLPLVSAVKTNVASRVRLLFDPPQLPHLLTALQNNLLESDVRINTLREETEWADPDPPLDMVVDGGDPTGA
jgi:hypothetical protein